MPESWLIHLATWVDPGTITYGAHYGWWQWEPPTWFLSMIMARKQ